MLKKINTIIKDIIKEQKIDKLQETQKDIKKFLGQKFLLKHIKEIFIQNNKIIIETKTIEAKTELNLVKKKLKTQITLL